MVQYFCCTYRCVCIIELFMKCSGIYWENVNIRIEWKINWNGFVMWYVFIVQSNGEILWINLVQLVLHVFLIFQLVHGYNWCIPSIAHVSIDCKQHVNRLHRFSYETSNSQCIAKWTFFGIKLVFLFWNLWRSWNILIRICLTFW